MPVPTPDAASPPVAVPSAADPAAPATGPPSRLALTVLPPGTDGDAARATLESAV